jgi:hypothetical protein
VIDEGFTVGMDDPDYCFSCHKTFLDFILVVGDRMGIDMFVPNVPANHTFAFELNLKNSWREFRCKHGILGFDPTGAMLCVGEGTVETYYIGLAREEYFSGTEPPFNMDEDHGDTRMSEAHYRILIIFLMMMLSDLPGRDFYLFNPHRLNPFDTTRDIWLGTNMM